MKDKIAILIIAASIVVLCSAYIGLGSFAQWIVVSVILIWIGLPALLGSLLYACIRARTEGWLSLRPAAWITGLAVAAIASCELGDHICEWEVRRAKTCAETLIDHLNRFQKTTGSYPESLSDKGLAFTAPRLLRYQRTDRNFVLFLDDPRQLLGGWIYDATTHNWKYES